MSSSTRVIFDPKRQSDTVILPFDFSPYLGVGETISSPVITASVWSGVDASPSSILSGSTTTSGSIVTTRVLAGVTGVIYVVKCTVNTSLSQVRSLVGLLAVIPDGI